MRTTTPVSVLASSSSRDVRLASRGAARPAHRAGFSVGTPRTIKNGDRGTLYCSSVSENYRATIIPLLFERKRELQREFQYQRLVVLEMALRAFSRTVRK